jgi:hypothetical protein
VTTSITYRVNGVADADYGDSVSFDIETLCLTLGKII